MELKQNTAGKCEVSFRVIGCSFAIKMLLVKFDMDVEHRSQVYATPSLLFSNILFVRTGLGGPIILLNTLSLSLRFQKQTINKIYIMDERSIIYYWS